MGDGANTMSVLQKIANEQTTIKKIRKTENTKGVIAGLLLGLTIGATYTFSTIEFKKLWHDYQEALNIFEQHEVWKIENKIGGVMVTAVAQASTGGAETGESVQTPTPTPKAIIATTYNAEVAQTDADPFTMASGKRVYEGAVASNCLPLGTQIEIPGHGKFAVEDRMNSRYTADCGTENERMDIFKWERKDNFKKNLTYIVL